MTFDLYEDGPRLDYFFHPHNCGVASSARRTERTVELPIANFWLNRRDALGSQELLVEVGAVTPYYWPGRVDTIVDPADKKATIRGSLFQTSFKDQDVISISTIEHVGERRYGLREDKTPEEALIKIIRESNRFLLTVPYGGSPASPDFEMKIFQLASSGEGEFRLFKLSRRPDELWEPSVECHPYGKAPKPWANTVLILERGGLL